MKRGVVLGGSALVIITLIVVKLLSQPDADIAEVVLNEATLSDTETILPDELLEKAAKENLNEDSVFDMAFQEQEAVNDIEVQEIQIDFEQVKNRKPTPAQSQFSKSYKVIIEDLKLSNNLTKFRITFDREVEDVTSVVILGRNGESEIQNIRFNDEAMPVTESKTLFENDWYKSEDSFSLLSEVEFVAKTKGQGTLNIYLQVMGEE